MVWSKHITESNYRGEVLGPRDQQPGGWGGSSLACKSVWMWNPRKGDPDTGRLRGEHVKLGSSHTAFLPLAPHSLNALRMWSESLPFITLGEALAFCEVFPGACPFRSPSSSRPQRLLPRVFCIHVFAPCIRTNYSHTCFSDSMEKSLRAGIGLIPSYIPSA